MNTDKFVDNLLPFDGIVNYYGKIIDINNTEHYLSKLSKTIDWKNDQIKLFGRIITTRRKTAWYGDHDFKYTYSGSTKSALPWTDELLELKGIIEKITDSQYNSCLLNLYHDGEEGMSWHSDDEKMLGRNNVIASISLGAERKFAFKHKITNEKVSILLENGSLLVMKGETQSHWKHSLPLAKNVSMPRINLTFRTIIV